MGSFTVTTKSYVPGIAIKAIGPSKDGSWSIQVQRTNYAEVQKLRQIAVVSLVPADVVDPDRQVLRNLVVVPDGCETIEVCVGPTTIKTDTSNDYLGMEVRSQGHSGSDVPFREALILEPLHI